MTMDKERDQLLRDMRVEVVWTDKATMSIPLYERMKDYIARARVDKGEVETHITDMEIAHDMSHTAFCDEGHWRDEFIAAKEKAIAGLSSKPVEADTELTRLKRQVEVERDSISAEEIKGWRLDPKVHDAILNRADPFSVAWHQREKEHQAALSARAKPVEVGEDEIVEATWRAILNTPSHPKVTGELLARYEARAAAQAILAKYNVTEKL